MQLYLKNSFMIRRIIASAVPAALLATTAALSTTAPANAQFGGAHGGALLTSGSFTGMAADSFEQDFSVEGGPNDPAQYVEQQMQQMDAIQRATSTNDMGSSGINGIGYGGF